MPDFDPDEFLKQRNAAPPQNFNPDAFLQANPPAEPQPSVWADVGKAAITGPLRGLGQFATAQREPEFGTMGAVDVPPENLPTQADVEKVLPRAQTFPGRMVQGVGEVAGNPLSWLGPGGLATKAAGIAASGLGSEVGQQIGGPIGGLIGGGLGSIAGESSLSRLAAARGVPPPTAAGIKAAATRGYEQARAMNVPIRRDAVQNLGRSIRGELASPQFGHAPFNEPQTFNALRLLEEPASMTNRQLRQRMGTLDHSSSTEILGVRQTLSNIRMNNPGTSDALAASRAIERIDAYLDNIPGLNDVTKGARGNWRAAAHAEELNNAIDRATRQAEARRGNVADNMRAEINRLIEDKGVPRTPQEEVEMRRIVGSGGILQEMARFRHTYSPVAIAGAVGSALAGHLLPAAGLAGSALAAGLPRRIDTARTRRGIEALRDQILRNAPAGGGPAPPLPAWFSMQQVPPAIVRSLSGNLSDLANGQR